MSSACITFYCLCACMVISFFKRHLRVSDACVFPHFVNIDKDVVDGSMGNMSCRGGRVTCAVLGRPLCFRDTERTGTTAMTRNRALRRRHCLLSHRFPHSALLLLLPLLHNIPRRHPPTELTRD